MYICRNCQKSFTFARIVFTDAIDSPGVRKKVMLCPFCDSSDFYEKKGGYCRCCGTKISLPGREYCSSTCQRAGEKLWERQRQRTIARLTDPILNAVAEVDAYNQRTGQKLSYGQYFALKGAGHI